MSGLSQTEQLNLSILVQISFASYLVLQMIFIQYWKMTVFHKYMNLEIKVLILKLTIKVLLKLLK